MQGKGLTLSINPQSEFEGKIKVSKTHWTLRYQIGLMNNQTLNEKYLVDKEGNRIGVILSMQDYRSLINRLEELESFKAAREEINIVDQILSEAAEDGVDETLPTFKRRQGPGGMIVI